MIVAINSINSIISIISIILTISTFSYSFCRLLDMFRTVFPYVNRLGRLIMDTEKAHSIKHCHLDVINFANPINCSCDGPEGGHKKWVKEQGAKTNQGVTSALTMMEHSVRKEASEMLCDAIQSRIDEGDAPEDRWTDSRGRDIHANRFWPKVDGEIPESLDGDEGPCMGIRVNIWERAKVKRHQVHSLSGGGGYMYGGYDALNHMVIIAQGNAGKLGSYPILSKLPDKFMRFLYEFHEFRFKRLNLPPLPNDRSDIDVHSVLEPHQVML